MRVYYTYPAEPDATEYRVLRLTVREATVRDMARYRLLMRRTTEWLDERFGPLPDSTDDDTDAEMDSERMVYAEALYARCHMLATLAKLEEGKFAPDADEPDAWREIDLPDEWQDFEGWLTLPGVLVDEWDVAVRQTNANLFVRGLEKKVLRPGGVYSTK